MYSIIIYSLIVIIKDKSSNSKVNGLHLHLLLWVSFLFLCPTLWGKMLWVFVHEKAVLFDKEGRKEGRNKWRKKKEKEITAETTISLFWLTWCMTQSNTQRKLDILHQQ